MIVRYQPTIPRVRYSEVRVTAKVRVTRVRFRIKVSRYRLSRLVFRL